MHYAMRDVKDMGQQMGYRSLEWNWLKEAMNRPIGAGIVECFILLVCLLVNLFPLLLFRFSPCL